MNILVGLFILGMGSLATAQNVASHATTTASSRVRLDFIPATDHYQLTYAGPVAEQVTLELFDNQGNLLDRQQIQSTNSFTKYYNVAYLPEGSYTFNVRSKTFRYEEEVEYKPIQPSISLLSADSPEKCKLVMNNFKKGPLFVRVYDDQERLLFENTVVAKGTIAQVYDLKQANANAVTFVVTNEAGYAARQTYSLKR